VVPPRFGTQLDGQFAGSISRLGVLNEYGVY
jgi:hypothetical protein